MTVVPIAAVQVERLPALLLRQMPRRWSAYAEDLAQEVALQMVLAFPGMTEFGPCELAFGHGVLRHLLGKMARGFRVEKRQELFGGEAGHDPLDTLPGKTTDIERTIDAEKELDRILRYLQALEPRLGSLQRKIVSLMRQGMSVRAIAQDCKTTVGNVERAIVGIGKRVRKWRKPEPQGYLSGWICGSMDAAVDYTLQHH